MARVLDLYKHIVDFKSLHTPDKIAGFFFFFNVTKKKKKKDESR